ncbi:hypothetical protein ACFQO9_15385 [Chryseobacterium zhengzhouense]|uniref:Glycosyltransferase RgtA/B/C/D-like domain-containing protein n=1 Tax=Chryseobacterium zhengzhouense TaxID=1636086 RepID=A0ABW2M2G5_9FLAO
MVDRIKLGQKIYKDFDYIRPFFSIIFWDFLLKPISANSEFSILLSRILVIVESFIICYVIQKLIFEKTHLQLTIFLLICFLHSFPIMTWHTIDGIFFSILSLFFYKKKWNFSALIFIVLASLVKQSFFIFGFVMTIIILQDLYKNRKIDKRDFYIFISTAILLIFSLFQYGIIENFEYFFKQVFNSSASSNFYESSIAVYFFNNKIATAAFILFLISIYFIKINRKIIEVLLTILFPIIIIFPFFNQGVFLGIHSLFLILIILFLKYEPENKFAFFLLFLAWSSSISWGYNTPIFFILILIYKFIEKKTRFFLFLWGIILVTFFIYRIRYTYLSDSLLTTKHIITKNITSISGLLISENEYFYILEAQQINKNYKDVIFLPGSPILDIINLNFPNRASWEMDIEYPNWKRDLNKLKTNIIAVDNKQNYYKEGFYISSFALELIKRKKIIKKTKYFTIYGN